MELHNTAIAVQADSMLASKLYQEQTEQVREVCKDHSLARALTANQDLTIQEAEACPLGQNKNAAAVRLLCCACNGDTPDTLAYLCALCSPAGELISLRPLTQRTSNEQHVVATTLHGHAVLQSWI